MGRHSSTADSGGQRGERFAEGAAAAQYAHESADGEHPIDVGLYYLSFMQEACQEEDVRFRSYVHQLGAAAPTLVNLVLAL